MTDLNRLRVSLTKHNAHKVARLLKSYKAAEVFARLGEVEAEPSQARKNLSTLPNGALPPVWSKVQQLGPDAIDALVLIALIFSHKDLIAAMVSASGRKSFVGAIERNKQLNGKAYTNFVRWLDQLGYATKVEGDQVTFNLKGMFRIPAFGALVRELLELKLAEAKWDRRNSVSDEAAANGFHRVFGIKRIELKAWLDADACPGAAATSLTSKDEEFFDEEVEGKAPKKFEFKPGHAERDVDPLAKAGSPKSKANQLHNDLQNKLYQHLKNKLGPEHVGTEVNSGNGTSIDLVTQCDGVTNFYEIKTGSSVRSSIRQAIPQLLEYAYWGADDIADNLIIVSHLPITKSAEKYVDYLRNKFGMPLEYQQFDLKSGQLI